MTDKERIDADASEEQIIYARTLEISVYIGLTTLSVTYFLYVSGLVAPFIPIEKVPDYWSLNVHDYLEQTGASSGLGWAGMLGYGDFLNFVGVVALAGTTVVCYLSIIPTLLRNKDYIYVALAIVEVIVLLVAVSGVTIWL